MKTPHTALIQQELVGKNVPCSTYIVDRYVHQLDKESNEPHDKETSCCGLGNLHELFSIRLRAFLHQVHRVPGKLLEGLNQKLFESVFLSHFVVCWLFLYIWWIITVNIGIEGVKEGIEKTRVRHSYANHLARQNANYQQSHHHRSQHTKDGDWFWSALLREQKLEPQRFLPRHHCIVYPVALSILCVTLNSCLNLRFLIQEDG